MPSQGSVSGPPTCQGLVFYHFIDVKRFTELLLPSCLGIIISGGRKDWEHDLGLDTVEVFLPFTNQHCRLPNLPLPRYAHTMDGFLICGGIL